MGKNIFSIIIISFVLLISCNNYKQKNERAIKITLSGWQRTIFAQKKASNSLKNNDELILFKKINPLIYDEIIDSFNISDKKISEEDESLPKLEAKYKTEAIDRREEFIESEIKYRISRKEITNLNKISLEGVISNIQKGINHGSSLSPNSQFYWASKEILLDYLNEIVSIEDDIIRQLKELP